MKEMQANMKMIILFLMNNGGNTLIKLTNTEFLRSIGHSIFSSS